MSRIGASKRQKEQARLDRRKEKDAQREQRKVEKATRPERDPNAIDPDIKRIVPGPRNPRAVTSRT